ncbi:hypothetical protein G647_02810 [Cladophialophora carrionii CBS 160.54]|uniref:CFEM domain-containing protein n=1 Tax=Cladophialophora carrionii CBS 160.54 TaxID=1279043 RepID=V9DI89_9EURO|nr:uncharacterized protein G647_02810 [Cladophialophora carrionii CBS 160.54]ETI26033.1 hypothetical protein G647_02810 [Cladophialophora carrionii CBS 160.54]
MHFQIFTALLLTALTQARPQTPADTSALAGLPACAVRDAAPHTAPATDFDADLNTQQQDAANSALGSSGCAAKAKDCICSSQPFIAAITTAVTQTCTAQDVQAALIFAQTYCGAALSAGDSSASSSSGPAATGDAAATSDSAAPTSSPSATEDNTDYTGGASTTTVPGTVTATTSVLGASVSVSTVPETSVTGMMPSGVVMTTTQCTTTTTVMTTQAKTMSYNATYTGAAVKSVGQGIMAAVVGVAGAVAML